jgi:hypothetical protein
MISVVHCLQQPFDVYVGRPSIFGNPFKITRKRSRLKTLKRYAGWLLNNSPLLRQLELLRDKRLGCWCAPLPCHGHVLAALANETIDPEDLRRWAEEDWWSRDSHLHIEDIVFPKSLETV